jgi:hypothetical protein
MTHQVVSDVPIPDDKGRGHKLKYPFQRMAVGTCIELFDEKSLAAARNAAWREKKRNPEFNYTAIAYGPDSGEIARDADGNIQVPAIPVYGRLWRIAAEG